jgi:hypothetical protein
MPPKDAVLNAAAAAVPALSLAQHIHHISVRPGANVVDISFQTQLPTVPIVEIRLPRTDQHAEQEIDTVFPLFGGLRQAHNVRMDGLKPRTRYGYIIRAGGPPGSGLGAAAVSGVFTTGSRRAHVVFTRLTIHAVSDNQMIFKCALYDGTTQQIIGQQMRQPPGGGMLEIGPTSIASPFPDVPVPDAPPILHVYGWGFEQDDDWEINFGLNIVGELLPSTTPTPRGIVALDDEIVGDALETLALAEFPGPPQRQDFLLSALHERFGYEIAGYVDSSVTAAPPTLVPNDRPLLHTGTSRIAGQIAAVVPPGPGGGKAHMFTIGPDGGAYRHVETAGRTRRTSWARVGKGLAPPLTVVAGKRNEIHLFAAADRGGVLHGLLSNAGDARSKPAWQRLEGDATRDMFVVQGDGATDLFAIDRAGAVHHLSLAGKGKTRARRWDALGGCFSGRLFAVAARGGFDVFVWEPNRGVFHAHWTPATRGREPEWTSLGSRFTGPAFAEVDDDGKVVVVGFREGAPAVYKTLDRRGRWEPEGDAWAPLEPEKKPRGQAGQQQPRRRRK